MIRIAINGFGRIGRACLRAAHEYKDQVQIVAINDLGNPENLAYLAKYDSVYGKAPFAISLDADFMIAGDWNIKMRAEKDPAKLPWKDLGVDVVIESTGFFTEYSKAKAHIDAGAKKVVISAPGKGDPKDAGVPSAMVLMGVNDDILRDCIVSSNASCTTNAVAPVIVALDEAIGIEKAILNTTHAYTATQSIVDCAAKDDFRRGRAGALNMSPSSTGAAKAVGLVYSSMKGKFDGIAIRVPIPAGSIADITFISRRNTTADEVNSVLKHAASTERWNKTFAVSDEQIVSSDIVGSVYGSIADLTSTKVVDGNLVKVLAWYDNEMGYTHTLMRHVIKISH